MLNRNTKSLNFSYFYSNKTLKLWNCQDLEKQSRPFVRVFQQAKLKNFNVEHRRSRCLAFGICEASEASIHKLAKAWGCFEGSRQYILSCENKFQMRPFGQGNCYPQTWQKTMVFLFIKGVLDWLKKFWDFFVNAKVAKWDNSIQGPIWIRTKIKS